MSQRLLLQSITLKVGLNLSQSAKAAVSCLNPISDTVVCA